MENEIWKPVRGYEGLYEVSNMGRFKSVAREVLHGHSGKLTIRERIRNARIMKAHGYRALELSKNGVKKTHRAHILVAQAFCDGEAEGLIVHHINHDKADNRAENLEWVTRTENVQAAISAGVPIGKYKRTDNGHRGKLTPEMVRMIRAAIASRTPVREIAEAMKLGRDAIYSIRNGESWPDLPPPTALHLGMAKAYFQ